MFRRVGYALALRGLLISWIKWVQGEMRRNESDGLREYGVALQHHIELVNQLIKAWGKQISDRSTPAEFDDLKTEMRKLPTKHNMVLLSSSQTWIAAVAKTKAAQEVCDHQVQSEQVEAEARSANLQQMIDLLTKSNPDLGKAAAEKLAATVLKKHGGKFRLAAAHNTELARNEEDLQIALWYSNAAELQESQK